MRSDISRFVEHMAESVNYMDLTNRKRELVKAGFRFAINYANQKYKDEPAPVEVE